MTLEGNNFNMCLHDSSFFLSGSISDPPTVKPSKFYQCPNTTANYTCHGSNVSEMSWRVESFGLPVTFFPRVNETDVIEGSQYDAYYGKLISVDINGEADNITTQLILTTSELKNGTKIKCHTFYFQEEMFTSFAYIFSAGM